MTGCRSTPGTLGSKSPPYSRFRRRPRQGAARWPRGRPRRPDAYQDVSRYRRAEVPDLFGPEADEANEAFRSTRCPPDGVRGVAGPTRASLYGLAAEYPRRTNGEIHAPARIGTAEAPEASDDITAIDGAFIGPSDLWASPGKLGGPRPERCPGHLKSAAPRALAT